MPGVGKTTLAEVVLKQATEQKLFDKVVSVTLSQTPNFNEMRERIAELFGLKFKASTEKGKAEELWRRLKGEKKILIILDDVWEKLELHTIGIPFGGEHEGCKILLTTRLQQVCSQMDCQEEFKLNILSEDEAWALFKDKAALKDDSPTLNVAKEVAHECGGLPLAIVTVANALKGESEDGWIAANKRLKSSRHLDNQHVPLGLSLHMPPPYSIVIQESYAFALWKFDPHHLPLPIRIIFQSANIPLLQL
ncbi:NB-ARC - like 10 [Theobroma cacao]|nr:NB-ARC - like 10 [Theobroma cacao]